MAQAGVSLHHVSHYIHVGLPGPSAAIMASVFAFAQVPTGLMWSGLTGDVPVRRALALSGLFVAMGAAGTAFSTSVWNGVISAGFLGTGVGGLHLLLRLAWAEYYGRLHLGAIRGITLPIQIGGQADWSDHGRCGVRLCRVVCPRLRVFRRGGADRELPGAHCDSSQYPRRSE